MYHRQIARDLTCATSAKGAAGRRLIRVMENATGRIGLIKRAEGYADEVAAGQGFWQL